jgi:hypothetical protein
VKAKQLVEALLDDEPEDRHERAYARLQKLYTRRGELQSEQMFHATWAITLRRLGVDEANIKSLDIEQGKLHGIYLKQGDYGAKIRRKAAAKDAQNARLDAKHDELYPFHKENPDKNYWQRQFVPKNASPSEVSAYYVPVNPPLHIPPAVLRSWGRS